MDEKIIQDYPTYAITNTGLVRDLRTGTLHNGHCHNGYRAITLTNPLGSNGFLIHRLVGKYFIENPNNYLEIDHINRICDDNRVENLRWANDFIQSQNKGNQINNKSGYKNITLEDNYFRVIITRNKKILARKRFQKIDDALKYRNEMYQKFNID